MPNRRSAFRNRAEAAGFSLAHALVSRLTPEGAEALGRRLGGLYRMVDGKRRRLAEGNLAGAFPGKSVGEVRALARAVFAHFGGLAFDAVRAADEPIESLFARVEIVNEEHAQAAVASSRGVFFLASHLGNWELAALVAAARGLPMTVIARPLDNPILEERLRSFRERSGNRVQPKTDAARELLRVLRRGGTIGILADQHARPPDAVTVPFFGRPAATTSSVARLADRTEALILPAAATRIAPARYRLVFEEPVDVRALSPEERMPEALTARLNRILEDQIRRCPEQWLWLHNRWRMD